ncbi:MAG: PaaI family thioesterase [Burkholderiaceae bacterium]
MSSDIPTNSLFSMVSRGELPMPAAAALLGLKVEHAERGSVDLSFRADESFLNAAGSIQGGMLSAMLDEALSLSMLTTLDRGEYLVTLEMKVQFISAAQTGALRARGWLIHRGRRIGFVEGDLRQGERLVAKASATVSIQGSARQPAVTPDARASQPLDANDR